VTLPGRLRENEPIERHGDYRHMLQTWPSLFTLPLSAGSEAIERRAQQLRWLISMSSLSETGHYINFWGRK
jgi:hypothetical protein